MKNPTKLTTLILSALIFSLFSTTLLDASVLTYEGFTGYTSGNTIVGDNGGTGWGGIWDSGQSDGFIHTVRNPTSINYSGYTSSTTPAASVGNYLNLAAGFGGANPDGVFRPLDTSAGGVYGSNGYLLSPGVIGADNTTLYGSFLYSNDGGQNSIANFTLNGAGSFTTQLPFTSTSNLLVFRINFGVGAADTVTLFSNPNLSTFNGTQGGATSAPGNYSFNTYVLTETLNGGGGAEVQYDDIRFGTTLADVIPVPEPSTNMLIGLSGVGAVFLRKKLRNLFA